jgi:hypothetical protein
MQGRAHAGDRFTVLRYGTSPLYGPPSVRNFSSPDQQTRRSPCRTIGYGRILSY